MTNPTNTPSNPDRDSHAAGLYQAMALRFYCRYVDMRRHAEFRGSDLGGKHGSLPTALDASEQYKAAVDEWRYEEPNTLDAVHALVEFAAVIAADKIVGEALRESGPVGADLDAYHQVIALAAAGGNLNMRSMAEWLDKRRAVYGPSGMAPKGAAA